MNAWSGSPWTSPSAIQEQRGTQTQPAHPELSRAHIAHATKGEALRKQLSALWNAVVQHGLNDYIPSALASKVKELLETPDVKAADNTQGEKIQEPRPSDALQSSGKRPRTT